MDQDGLITTMQVVSSAHTALVLQNSGDPPTQVSIWQDDVRERILFLIDLALREVVTAGDGLLDHVSSGSKATTLNTGGKVAITYPFSLKPYFIYAKPTHENNCRMPVQLLGLRRILELVKSCVLARRTVTLRYVYYSPWYQRRNASHNGHKVQDVPTIA